MLPSPGVYLSGCLNLTGDNLALVIQSGAVLRSGLGIHEWPQSTRVPDHPVNETGKVTAQPFIYSQNTHKLSIRGGGAIEVNGHDWWVDKCENGSKRERPFVIRTDNCRDVDIRDITILNQPFWTIVPVACHGVTIVNISIVAPQWSPNTDGIEPMSSTSVLVDGVFVHNGDDCITVKGGCIDITIRDSYLMAGHGASIGSVTDLGV
eukprot:COSAG05_NODE_9222_length_638_cov_1.025974_1_plen_206_part_01